MATTMLPIKSLGVKACATTTGHRKPGPTKGNIPSSSKWWGPVFGWSTEPDYIDNTTENKNNLVPNPNVTDPKDAAKARFAPGAFTAEKAKQLRMMTSETTAFHDAMYHSSIAAKLASDFSRR